MSNGGCGGPLGRLGPRGRRVRPATRRRRGDATFAPTPCPPAATDSSCCRSSSPNAGRCGTPTCAAHSSACRQHHTRGHLVRAAVEGVAFQLATILDGLEAVETGHVGPRHRRRLPRRAVARGTAGVLGRPLAVTGGGRGHGARCRRARPVRDRRGDSPSAWRRSCSRPPTMTTSWRRRPRRASRPTARFARVGTLLDQLRERRSCGTPANRGNRLATSGNSLARLALGLH